MGQSCQGSHRALFLGWGRQPGASLPCKWGPGHLWMGMVCPACLASLGREADLQWRQEATVRPLASCLRPAEGLAWLWAGWSHEQLTEGGREGGLDGGCLG